MVITGHSSREDNVLGEGPHPRQCHIRNSIVYNLVNRFESFGRLTDGVLEGVIIVSDRLRWLISSVWHTETEDGHLLNR